MTLRSAIAGFFYKNHVDALDTKGKQLKCFDVACNTKGRDPFENVLPRASSGSSMNSSGSDFPGNLNPIKEIADIDNFDVIHGNTYCRIVYDAPKCYPDLRLPFSVFVKLYHYSSRLWEENDLACYSIPHKRGYYEMFFNELIINEKIANSQFAPNFPMLLVSGYWNGLPDHPMHIFEYLGKELPTEKWNWK